MILASSTLDVLRGGRPDGPVQVLSCPEKISVAAFIFSSYASAKCLDRLLGSCWCRQKRVTKSGAAQNSGHD
jgi:hypothetical protein